MNGEVFELRSAGEQEQSADEAYEILTENIAFVQPTVISYIK